MEARPLRYNFKWVTDAYFGDFEDRVLINHGWCYCFAWICKIAAPEAQLVVTSYMSSAIHASIRVGHLYYDSSRPTGVRDIAALHCLIDEDWECHEEVSMDRFKQIWDPRNQSLEFRSQGLTPWLLELPYVPRRELWIGPQLDGLGVPWKKRRRTISQIRETMG